MSEKEKEVTAGEEAAFKHGHSTSRDFGFITVQYDQLLLPSLSKSLML